MVGAVAVTTWLLMPGAAAAKASTQITGVPQSLEPSLAASQIQFHNVGNTSVCMGVKNVDVYPNNALVQLQCNSNDPFQDWDSIPVDSTDGQYPYEYQNLANGQCLYAASWQAYDKGAIFTMPCNGSDPYQWWIRRPASDGLAIKNVGTSNGSAGTCLDAYGATGGGAGQPIFQLTCNPTDQFQLWSIF